MAKIDIGQRFYEARTKFNKHNKKGKVESIRMVCESEDVKIKPSSLYLYEANHDDTGRIPNTKNAQKLADHYGVNVLWLLGQSDSWSVDENSQIVTEITGLSTEAVANLQKIKGTELTVVLNSLIENEGLLQMLQYYARARKINAQSTQTEEQAKIIEGLQGVGIDNGMDSINSRYSDRQQVDMYLWKGSHILEDSFRLIMKGDKDNGNRNEKN